MIDPFPETPDGTAEPNILDRSEQAARFLDLARQRALSSDEPTQLFPLIAAQHETPVGPDRDGFGDGNGFGSGLAFGADDDPDDPFD